MRRVISRTHGAVLLALVVLAGACSNGDDAASSTTSRSATTTSTAPATTAGTSSTTTTTRATSTTTVPDAPPSQVTGVTARTGGGSGEVVIAWTQNPEPDVVNYTISRATTPGGASTQIATVTRAQVNGFPTTAYVDLPPVRVAYYRVRAVDAAGNQGPLSTEVCGSAPGSSC
jgi:hypothetical protein